MGDPQSKQVKFRGIPAHLVEHPANHRFVILKFRCGRKNSTFTDILQRFSQGKLGSNTQPGTTDSKLAMQGYTERAIPQ